ncbi:MAG TPA: glycosyltransferase family 39 protein [Terriglobia bacterium]|nr:glycosyltransferase family 39 protein [Terriglobia bacterium]
MIDKFWQPTPSLHEKTGCYLLSLRALRIFDSIRNIVSETSTPAQTGSETAPSSQRQVPPLAVGMVVGLAATKLLIHLLTGGRYGYFRDELYYLDAARHLDWGFVDFAPLVAVYAKVGLMLGGSLHAIRLIPALAGAGVVALAMYIAQQLGGGRFAQALAGLAVLFSSGFLVIDNILSMNAVEPLFWMGAIAVLIRIVNTGNSRLWLWFGVLAGLGLENKHSTVFFGFTVVVALLLTEHRSEFKKPWIWLGGAVAFLIFLPNLLWQVRHNFATLEDLENVRRMGKNIVLGPVEFVWQQIYLLHPLLFPIWLAGLVSFLWHRRTRILGWTFVVFFLTMFAVHAKHYYLLPIYPMLLAGGAVAMERWLEARAATRRKLWPRAAIVVVIVFVASVVDVFMLPILPPEKYIKHSAFLHLSQLQTEVHHKSTWPQIFADQFGWEELVAEVAKIYQSLPPEERRQTAIFANNYGEAGAIDFFGPKHGLPPAICAHQNYYFWGPPDFTGDTYIVLQGRRSDLEQHFQSVDEAATHYHPYGMEEEDNPIYLCRGPKFKLSEVWPKLKHWN